MQIRHWFIYSVSLAAHAYAEEKPSDSTGVFTGRVRIMATTMLGNKSTSTISYYFEQEGTGNFIPFSVTNSTIASELRTGSVVRIRGSFEDRVLEASSVEHLHHDMTGLGLSIPSTGMKALVINPDFSICQGSNAMRFGTNWINSFLLENWSPTGITASSTLRACSKGKVFIDSQTTKVLTFRVSSDICSNPDFRWNSCDLNVWKYASRMKQIVLSMGGVDWDSYSNHWFVMPQTMNCPFAGTAAIGADGLFMNGGYLNYIRGWAHEIGHNLGLLHSFGRVDGSWKEYGDRTSIMGQSNACFNMAERNILGWEKPSKIINSSDLVHGKWAEFTIRASDKFQNVGLQINTRHRGPSGLNTSVYVEFRRSGQKWFDFVQNKTISRGGDEELSVDLQGANIYMHPNPFGGFNPIFAGNALPIKGRNFSDINYTGIHVQVLQNVTSENDTILIRVCRCAVGRTIYCCSKLGTQATAAAQKATIAGAIAAGVVAIGAASAGVILYRKKRTTASTVVLAPEKQHSDANAIQL